MRTILAVSLLTVALPAWSSEFQLNRRMMVETQIRARGVADKSTLAALGNVPRHQFVAKDLEALAYADRPLPIGYGQTISQPYIVAYMTEKLDLKPDHRILEIGTGSGYQAAVLASIVAEVYTIEIIGELAAQARERFQEMGYQNINLRQGDGYRGWEEAQPFDGIIVTAAAAHIPPPLIEQLKDGGKMIIPVGPSWGVQKLLLVTKEKGKTRTRSLLPVRFVPFTRNR